MPDIQVAANQGRLLYLLVRLLHCRRILEIGTLSAYSTIWLARGLADGGRVVGLELDSYQAAVARHNLHYTGMADKVDIITGAALDSLQQLQARCAEPFDLVFIDADKANSDT